MPGRWMRWLATGGGLARSIAAAFPSEFLSICCGLGGPRLRVSVRLWRCPMTTTTRSAALGPGAVSGHFLEVGSDVHAEFGAPGLEGFLEAATVTGLAAGDRHPAQGGSQFASGMIAGKDRG